MTIDDPAIEAVALRSSAAVARRTALTARTLAADIERRRFVLAHRIDDCLARHTDAMWTSAAAARSRVELRHMVGFSVWAADDALQRTCRQLALRADDLDDTARHDLRRAGRLDAEASVGAGVAAAVSEPAAS